MNLTGGSLNGATINGAGDLQVVGGVLTVQGNNSVLNGITVMSGTLDVNTSATLDVSTASSGVVIFPAAAAIIDGVVVGNVNNDGTLSGSGTVVGTVTNGGQFNPGNSPGTFTVDGDLNLLASSVLNIEIAGLVKGVTYDELIVTGNINFAGQLNVIIDTSSGYTGSLQDSFDPIVYNSGSGSITLNASKGYGYALTVDVDKINLILTLIPGLLIPDIQSAVVTLVSSTQNITKIETGDEVEAELASSEEENEDEQGSALVCT